MFAGKWEFPALALLNTHARTRDHPPHTQTHKHTHTQLGYLFTRGDVPGTEDRGLHHGQLRRDFVLGLLRQGKAPSQVPRMRQGGVEKWQARHIPVQEKVLSVVR